MLHASNCFKLLDSISSGSQSASNGLRIFLEAYAPKFLMSANAYFGRKNSFCTKKLIVRHNRRLNSTPRPQAYIGVGYRDHGTCSIESVDASPAWQKVASALVNSKSFSREINEFDPHLTTFSLFERKQVPRNHPW